MRSNSNFVLLPIEHFQFCQVSYEALQKLLIYFSHVSNGLACTAAALFFHWSHCREKRLSPSVASSGALRLHPQS